jgi:hypothetical protein
MLSNKNKCPKCGCGNLSKNYSPWNDILIKKCIDCNYKWEELPLDKQHPTSFSG